MQGLEKILEEIENVFKENIENIEDENGVHHFVINSFTAMSLAKDIIRNHMNDGWIPVEDRLPEEGQEVWVTENTDCVRRGTYTEAFGFGMRKGFICSDGFMCIGNVLAWKPYVYPEPYRPEMSNKRDNTL